MVMNKKGISAMVGYVLLISITLGLSVIVYNWLQFYVQDDPIETCSENVNIVIQSYDCIQSMIGGSSGYLNVTLKNKGLFIVDGYILRINTRAGADFGLHAFNSTGSSLKPGEEITMTYIFDDYIGPGLDFASRNELNAVTLIEVQPFIKNDAGEIKCQSSISQKITCE